MFYLFQVDRKTANLAAVLWNMWNESMEMWENTWDVDHSRDRMVTHICAMLQAPFKNRNNFILVGNIIHSSGTTANTCIKFSMTRSTSWAVINYYNFMHRHAHFLLFFHPWYQSFVLLRSSFRDRRLFLLLTFSFERTSLQEGLHLSNFSRQLITRTMHHGTTPYVAVHSSSNNSPRARLCTRTWWL